jgi:SAM-dependent methyltransferase
VLLSERIAALGYDYAAQPKERLGRCNLCGHDRFAIVTHSDRYGFPAESHGCLRCGLVFLNPRLSPAGYGAFYESVYRPLVSAYHGRLIDARSIEQEQAEYAAALEQLLEPFLDGGRGASLLDVGGSTGVVAAALAERFGLQATVVDPAPEELERAAARGLATAAGTMETLDLDGASFDLITICQTVDHLLDVAGAFAKARALVDEHGLLFVDIVDFRAACRRLRSVEGATKIDHPHSLTELTAEAYLARAGFTVVRKDYAADHLHVGYVCRPGSPVPDALPPPDDVARLYRELRAIQNDPARAS